jgi:hypothetical protein
MSNITPIGLAPSLGFFSRALNALDRALMNVALIAARNNEPTYLGL